MLEMTNINLELMTDIDMFQFIEKGMRGGVSYIANRHGKPNNKYMKEYNEKAPSKYIMYLDANNLYGWAMSQYLPTGNFKWMSDKEIKKIDLGKYTPLPKIWKRFSKWRPKIFHTVTLARENMKYSRQKCQIRSFLQ